MHLITIEHAPNHSSASIQQQMIQVNLRHGVLKDSGCNAAGTGVQDIGKMILQLSAETKPNDWL